MVSAQEQRLLHNFRSGENAFPLFSGHGFTLVEALVSAVILTFACTIMVGLYYTGLQTIQAQSDRSALDSVLRSQMEILISEKFDSVVGGTTTTTVSGIVYNVDWTVGGIDLNGDTVDEPNAKILTVTLDGRSLSTLVIDHGGRVSKL